MNETKLMGKVEESRGLFNEAVALANRDCFIFLRGPLLNSDITDLVAFANLKKVARFREISYDRFRQANNPIEIGVT